MKKYYEHIYAFFLFDRKAMGFTFFVPAIMFMLSLLLIVFVPSDKSSLYDKIIVIQCVFIPFSGWGLMYRLSEVYEEGAQETLIPYYSKRLLGDFLRYFQVNIIGVLILSVAFILRHGMPTFLTMNYIHFIVLVLIYMFFGTSLIVLIKNIEISLAILFVYTVLEAVTLGNYMPWPHIFLFEPPFWDPIFTGKLTFLAILIIIFVTITQVFIKRADRELHG